MGARLSGARRLAVVAVVAAIAMLVLWPAQAGAGVGERITAYGVDITIEPSGAILVREAIDYDFGNASGKHGIFRDIPVRLRYDDRYERIYPLDVISVEATGGASAKYEVQEEGVEKRIRIGDPDRTVSGAHRYTITYRVEAALNGFPDHDELYWNAIGAQWSVPIANASVRVEAPAPIQQAACFAGPLGSNLPCGSASHGGSTATFSQPSLDPNEALTVVVGFPKGAVASTAPVLDERWSFTRAFALTAFTVAASLALLAVVVASVVWMVWRTGRDRRWIGSHVDAVFGGEGPGGGPEQAVRLMERPLTPVEFVPPDDLRPGQVGTLVDEEANPLDVSATIVDLAVRGYLRITEIPKQGFFGKPDWQLTWLGKPYDSLLAYEQSLLGGLFEDGAEVKLSDLRNVFAARLRKVQDALYDDMVARGWFTSRPDRTRTKWKVLGILATLVGAALVFVTAAFTHFGLLPVPLLIGGLLLWAFAGKMPRRTAKGTGVLRQVLGFRRFITESEAERAQFAERKHLFTEYLPYAMVFGVTEQWARTFAGLEGELPAPDWYVGSGFYTPLVFAHSMDGFAVNTSGTITSTPSGSGSSGFGGGGFSGGGGGGGGGGSW